MNHYPRRFLIALGALALADARADEWSIEPGVQLSADYSKNPGLVFSPEHQVYGAVADLTAKFAWRSPSATLIAQPDIRVVRYPSYETLNGTDSSLNLSWTQGLERGQLSASALMLRDDTIATDLDTTGYAEVNRRRDYYHFELDGQWHASERMLLGAGLNYEATDFARDPLVFLVDYKYPSFLVYAQRSLDERTRLALTASAAGVRGEQVVESNNYSLTVRLDRSWNEHWVSSFSIGPSLVSPKDGSSTHGIVFLADLTHTGERTNWQVRALREQRASGRGVLEGRDELSGGVSRSMTENLRADLSLRLIRTRESYHSLVGGDLLRGYGYAQAGLSWQWAQHWNLRFSYDYSQQHYTPLDTDLVGHHVSLGVAWNGMRMATSR